MIDKLFPFLVGHRTEVLALLNAVAQLAAATGLIDHGTANGFAAITTPAAVATFAAKFGRA